MALDLARSRTRHRSATHPWRPRSREDLAEVVAAAGRPVWLLGVASAEDADRGGRGRHRCGGGRRRPRPAPRRTRHGEILPEVVDAVAGMLRVLAGGVVASGIDVLRLLALGRRRGGRRRRAPHRGPRGGAALRDAPDGLRDARGRRLRDRLRPPVRGAVIAVGARARRDHLRGRAVITFVEGTVAEVRADRVIVQVGGFGVEVLATPRALAGCRPGASVRLATHLVVREDSLTLYGFAERDARTSSSSPSGRRRRRAEGGARPALDPRAEQDRRGRGARATRRCSPPPPGSASAPPSAS
jgi:hypothetical protein